MNVIQKVEGMKDDLAKIVNLCNVNGEYRLAALTQGCLQQVGTLAETFGAPENEVAKKAVPGSG